MQLTSSIVSVGAYVGTCIVLIPFRTILAIAGDNFAVIASDTRLSEGYMIHSRDTPKTYNL